MLDTKLPKAKIYLTRRNLLTLLSKLDRESRGEPTNCGIIKYKQESPEYQQTMDSVIVFAVDDGAYYDAQQRTAGVMHHLEEEFISMLSKTVV